jgi:acyl carrier protein
MSNLVPTLTELIVAELGLDELDPSTVTDDTPLYREGFGLDSIDILEVSLLIAKKYGVKLRSDAPDNAEIFASIGALARYVEEHRTT